MRRRSKLRVFKQAAGAEASLRREFLARAEKAESEAAVMKNRIAWILERHEKQVANYNFANGFRAGLECALLALDGHDIIGNSIDPKPVK